MRLSRTALIGVALSVALMGQSLLGQAGGGGIDRWRPI